MTHPIATVDAIVEQIRGDGTKSVQTQLAALSSHFIAAARSIDPSIASAWEGREVRHSQGEDRLQGVFFERADQMLANVQKFEADPLVSAIEAWRVAMAEFNAIPDERLIRENEEDLVQATYGPHADLLYDHAPRPNSAAGVREAIRLAFDRDAFCDEMAEAVLRSALEYLDGRPA